jgi:hypothetical protein
MIGGRWAQGPTSQDATSGVQAALSQTLHPLVSRKAMTASIRSISTRSTNAHDAIYHSPYRRAIGLEESSLGKIARWSIAWSGPAASSRDR